MKILVFAPHNDDETIGMGGTIAKYASMGHEIFICEITSDQNLDVAEKIKKEALDAHKILGVKESIFLDLPVVGLKNMETTTLNHTIAQVVRAIKPELAFIPHKGDMHIDHEETSKAALVALRPLDNPDLKGIYAYETLSETEWNIQTADNVFYFNYWVNIEPFLEHKLEAMKCYISQLKQFPHPRSLDAMIALARLRGSTVGVAAAESFMIIRQIEK